jgi:3-phenylpropionate/trans-cinnamate dioxygenase ferredoxin reductase subunit
VPRPVVVIGASMGGLRVAETLRKNGYSGALTVIGDEPYPPYNRPPLSKEVLATQVDLEAVAFPIGESLEDVTWITGNGVASADLSGQTLNLQDGSEIEYETLIIATGLRSRRLDEFATPTDGRFAIRSLDDAIALRQAIEPGARVVIYGAGFIGCETAATARKLDADVTVVGKGEVPMLRPLGRQLAEDIQHRQEAHGVKFEMNARVVELLGDGSITGVKLDDGKTIECDVLVESIGSLPNTEFLEGNDIDIESGIRVNENLQALRVDGAPWPNVYAIGDVASFPIPQFDSRIRRVEHWNIPTEMARRVGKLVALQIQGDEEGLSEEYAKGFSPIPSFWSDQFEVSLLSYGLLDQAKEIRLLEGEVGGDCLYGYYRDDAMVGVCGVGMRQKVMSYRNKVGLDAKI